MINSFGATPSQKVPETALKNAIKVKYTNYRGETAIRTIIPGECRWGTSEYHKEEQWLMRVFDVDRNDYREYALQDIEEWFVK